MFLSENLPMFLKSVALKIGEDNHREAHCKFIIEPFNVNLARELGDEVAAHLFNDDDKPKREVESVSFHLVYGLQRLTARAHPELPAVAILEDVRVEGIKVTRPDPAKERLKLEFVAVVPIILERQVIEFIVSAFGSSLAITMFAQQPALKDALRQAVDDLKSMATEDGGSMSLSVVNPDGSKENIFTIGEKDDAPEKKQATPKKRGRKGVH